MRLMYYMMENTMQKSASKSSAIKEYIINNLPQHPKDISSVAAIHFDVTRQYIGRCINQLIKEGLLEGSGNTKSRQYNLKLFVDEVFSLPVTTDLEEDVVWRERILPHMFNVADNVLDICQYGFTEMLNNVISHSEGDQVLISVERSANNIRLMISDNGVGIFHKIQKAFGYDDPRHALLELSKGKLTSEKDKHSGEGIFFTSRMFDEFSILSGTLYFGRTNKGDDWLIETEDRSDKKGTIVLMCIDPNSERKMLDVFQKYSSEENYGFSRTHVPILLAKYENEQLLSRSQAKRVLARFDRFKEVMLDFSGVNMIGQAFADEIFRVYHNQHPEINIIPLHTSPEIDKMINHVRSISV